MGLQSLLHAVFPPECLNCGARVEDPFAICGECWAETPFILGAACDICGKALPGQTAASDVLVCEECTQLPRPWDKGRAVFGYSGVGRKLVLAMKHGDRTDVARAAGPWMARAAVDIVTKDTLIVPVPLHWRRLAKRRFNQAALLAQSLAREIGAEAAPMALHRPKPTPSQGGKDRDARFRNLDEALTPHPRHGQMLEGRTVVVVDDVMTSGATLTVATEACLSAGAENVCVLALARVADDT